MQWGSVENMGGYGAYSSQEIRARVYKLNQYNDYTILFQSLLSLSFIDIGEFLPLNLTPYLIHVRW